MRRPHNGRNGQLLEGQTVDLDQGSVNEERAGRNRATAAGLEPDNMDFDADRRGLLSAFGDPAFWAAAVMRAPSTARLTPRKEGA